MNTEFRELLSVSHDDKAQIWIIGTREQVMHTMNELYVKRVALDRAQFTPIVPAPFERGKYMALLVR